MTKLRWLALLMAMVILIIAGFQVYWLRDNYQRANRELEVKTGLLFRETYREMQDSLIGKRLRSAIGDSISGELKVGTNMRLATQMARAVDQIREDIVIDTTKPAKKTTRITVGDKDFLQPGDRVRFIPGPLDSIPPESIESISIFKENSSIGADTMMGSSSAVEFRLKPKGEVGKDSMKAGISQSSILYFTDNGNKRFVIRIDSLVNDSVRTEDLHRRFTEVLEREEMDIPFTIVPNEKRELFGFRRASFGRAETVRDTGPYQLKLGSVFPYLLMQLRLPILFSFFLVGITLFSFILLYRSLLRQQRLAQMKTDLISNITHELKTPIATVGVAIEALKNFNAIQDTRRTNEYLDISQQELQRLSLLVDKVLKLSMFEKKEIELQKQHFDMGQLAEEVLASLRLQVEKLHARIQISKEGPLEFWGDRLHWQSVIFNLLDNALKYSQSAPEISIAITGTEEQLKLEVADNGIGIPEGYQNKVFEKFFRVPAGDTHNAKGHGLGLSYVAQVVRQHGGNINLESQEGSGSTFTITLPRQAEASKL
jgi:two-component system phosphate regulon sensor histidine kinase PhoR